MNKSAQNRSSYIYLGASMSDESLRRALLVADTVHTLWTGYEAPNAYLEKVAKACLDRGRLALSDKDAQTSWKERVKLRKEAYYKWSLFFAEAICRAFKANSVKFELHDAGHRISFAWDNGLGVYPANLFPRGTIVAPIRWDDVAEMYEVVDSRRGHFEESGADEFAVDFASVHCFELAEQKMLLDCAMEDLVDKAPAYSRLGLLAEDRHQVAWVNGVLTQAIQYDYRAAEDMVMVIDAMAPKSSDEYKLSDIPIDRYLDLCDGLSAARRDFGSKIIKWSEEIGKAGEASEKREKLAKLRNGEIIPAMEEFNESTRAVIARILKSVSGSQYGSLALGAFAAAVAYLYGLPLEAVGGAGAAGVVAGVGGNVMKESVARNSSRRQQWTTFSAALSDEIAKWSGKQR